MKISEINHLDFDTLLKVLSSEKITETQKNQFVRQNMLKIEQIMSLEISAMDFKTLMQKRTLKKFQPLRNIFKKKGDKLILAKALNIQPSQVSDYIKNITNAIGNINQINFLSSEKMEILKTYVYRHGSKDDLIWFLNYELKKSKDFITTLYTTLQYNSGGVADYFIRPIHRMDNNTLIKIFNIINDNIQEAENCGKISKADSLKHAKWALVKIYTIQNNSKLINAIKTYKTLS